MAAANVGDLPLENISEEKKTPPKERLKDAASGREIYVAMTQADETSAGKRAEVQAMMDGKPPYSQAVLAATGQGSRTNLNFGDAEVIQANAEASMIDLVNSVETLVKTPLKASVVPDDDERFRLEQILADEVTRTFREWPNFMGNYQTVVQKWLAHGVGIAYFENSYCWQWEVSGLGDMQIPRETKASEDRIEVAGCRRGYKLHELWAKIKDEEMATRLGWNVAAVKEAMLKSAQSTRNTDFANGNWEKLAEGLRNNDLYTGGKCQEVAVVHLWVKEFDGRVSMYAMTEETLESTGIGKKDDFLYKKTGAYPGMANAFTFFTYGIGTNGCYHGIAGLMRRIYPQIQLMNRVRCNFVDASVMAGSIMLQPANETSYDKMSFTSIGGMMMLPAADVATFVERASPNLAQNITPVLADLQSALDQRSGQLNMDSPLQDSREKTRFEVDAIVQSRSRVGVAQLNLFYPPWGRLMRESTRRLCAMDYSDAKAGGKEAVEFRRRLAERGFDPEMLKAVDYDAVTCVKAIGAGSDAARVAAFTQLQALSGGYDAAGRHNLLLDQTAAALHSYEAANRYIKRLNQSSPPIDAQFAELENALMEGGKDVPIQINQLHTVHLDLHLPKLAQMLEAVEAGEIQMLDVVTPMTVIHAHCVQHLVQIQADPSIQEKIGVYRQALQAAGEIVWNANKQLQAEQQKAAQEEGAQEQQGGGLSPQMKDKLMEHRLRLDIMAEESERKRQAEIEKHAMKMMEMQQKMAMNDGLTASKVALMSAQAKNQAKKSA